MQLDLPLLETNTLAPQAVHDEAAEFEKYPGEHREHLLYAFVLDMSWK